MIEFVIHWMPLLDATAKIIGIIAIFGLVLAFCQYKNSVRIAERNERRAAVELAARECTNYGSVLTPQFIKLRNDIEVSGCQFFLHFKLIREENNLKPDASAVTEEDYSKLKEHIPETLRLFNSLEGFAIPFAAGVADDSVGFVECGRSFVSHFEQFFGLYARHELKHYYPSTQTLYWSWRRQITKDDRRRMHLNAGREFFALTESLIREESDSKVLRAMAPLLKKVNDELFKDQK
ncbi:MAG TPA: hypothetical protein VNN22_19465 [Verrucomicrobiae bacterium]|nr:hypothetical protein [Verrucomicrobiae bacterium]